MNNSTFRLNPIYISYHQAVITVNAHFSQPRWMQISFNFLLNTELEKKVRANQAVSFSSWHILNFWTADTILVQLMLLKAPLYAILYDLQLSFKTHYLLMSQAGLLKSFVMLIYLHLIAPLLNQNIYTSQVSYIVLNEALAYI